MPEDTKLTEAEAVANEVRAAFRPVLLDLQDPNDDTLKCQVIAYPNTEGGISFQTVVDYLDEFRLRPERREGNALLQDLDSFIEHVNRHKGDNSVIFADRTEPLLRAIIDYHEPGEAGEANWCKHHSIYRFPTSAEWTAWIQKSAKWMDSPTFAQFLDEHVVDVMNFPPEENPPGLVGRFLRLYGCNLASPNQLIVLSQGLTVHVESKVANHERRETGEIEIGFSSEVVRTSDRRGLAITVPGAFVLGIPVFERGKLYELPARLRYRTRDGKVEFAYDLFRASDVRDAAIEEACKHAADNTGLEFFYGRPES